MSVTNEKKVHHEEIELRAMNGMSCLIMNILAVLAFTAAFIFGIVMIVNENGPQAIALTLIIVGSLYAFVVGPILFVGLKILKPNEAFVMTLFGKYIGTLKGAGFYWVNPFCVAVNPAAGVTSTTSAAVKPQTDTIASAISSLNSFDSASLGIVNKRLSLKDMTLNNDKQKINDQLGNPIIIGIVVIWRVVNTAKAVFNVDNYKEYLSIQCDSALRNIVRLYPYDNPSNDNEESLRGSSQEVAEKLRDEIQKKVEVAGLEIVEARITHLSYSEEIAAVMLQRQQASAIIDARNMIVEGAVGMVEMALSKLSENDIVELDEERKAAMVSNLLVVLCGNRDAQPVVNSGSIY